MDKILSILVDLCLPCTFTEFHNESWIFFGLKNYHSCTLFHSDMYLLTLVVILLTFQPLCPSGRCLQMSVLIGNLIGILDHTYYSINGGKLFSVNFTWLGEITLICYDSPVYSPSYCMTISWTRVYDFFHITWHRDWTHNCWRIRYLLNNTLIHLVMCLIYSDSVEEWEQSIHTYWIKGSVKNLKQVSYYDRNLKMVRVYIGWNIIRIKT